MKTLSANELQRIESHELRNGLKRIYLRKNIEQTEDGWRADEVELVGNYNQAYIESHFAELWSKATRASMSAQERMVDIETLQADQDAAICGLYELLIGAE